MFVVRRKKIVEVISGLKEEVWEYITGISAQWKIVQTSKFSTTALKFQSATAAQSWLNKHIDTVPGINSDSVRVEQLLDERKDYGEKEIGDE
jgi:hypothetical protein